MFYYVTDYEYYITGPETMSVKTGEPLPRRAGERERGVGGEKRDADKRAQREIIQERHWW